MALKMKKLYAPYSDIISIKYFYQYTNASNCKGQVIVFVQYNSESSSLRVDTEEAKVEKIVINGSEGLLVEKEQLITILWHNDNSSFYLKSKTDKDLLIKIAESINYKK